jgi:hypothetical protein
MSAVLSVDGLFRYELRRSCGLGEGKVTWVMFNPSTAEMIVVNLLPIRSPDPKEAWAWHRRYIDFGYPAPEFFTNADYIDRAADESEKVVAAWGSLAKDLGWATRDNHAIDFWCLGVNSDGQPKHPLYVAKDTPLQRLGAL